MTVTVEVKNTVNGKRSLEYREMGERRWHFVDIRIT